MHKRFTLPLFVVALLTTILFGTYFLTQPINVVHADGHQADKTPPKTEVVQLEIPKDSVLHLIPETALGLIYCPSLLDLDDRINAVATELVPQAGTSPELLAQILADSFGAGFESLAELEEIGLDLNQDFAVFLTSLDPPSLSATIHLTDPDAMQQVIETEAEGGEPIQYNGETYWSSPEGSGSFAILDNTLIFSQQPEVCQNVIDISKGTMKSIVASQNYASFLTNIMKGTDQLAAHFNLESIIAPFSDSIKDDLESTIDAIESDPTSMAAVPMMENMFSTFMDLIEELQSISAALQVDGTDVQLATTLQFKTDGQIQERLKELTPNELVLLNDLPNSAFINGAFQGNPQLLVDLSMSWIKPFFKENAEQSQDFEDLLQQMKGIYESMGDEWSFSANFKDNIIPDYLVIYSLKDEQKVKDYYENQMLEVLQKTMQVMRNTLGDIPQLSMYDGVYVGDPIMHNDIEIKTFVFPNFGAAFVDMPPETANLISQEWQWCYAISEGHLFFGIGGPELVKAALDSKAKVGESLSENVSYQKLIEKLGSENNLFLGISPLALAKGVMNLASKSDPNVAAQMHMFSGFIMGIPETYSIGFSGKVQDNGIGAKLLFTLGDFKQLIQTAVMMPQMGPMQ